ncbi:MULTISPECIES: prolyl oligopeptidase family serine peptidase [Pseudoalteromonas]|uniref:prolyl oligopeptidase n=1 Tax=Pseudoalteromonas amylolytica TaxID=1859457 RepID=A0A1S1MX23_9GAMM|nr:MULTISPECIES: prolyl oligopeptidase family serine peptidase [Pseudoalteromonas]OHU85091.1 prolyl endopeptidase [Pseudoalteromonas sp. JW3]OHU89957.1 prolyl endopeptidase [Pseudoalteromonas amylolytica]
MLKKTLLACALISLSGCQNTNDFKQETQNNMQTNTSPLTYPKTRKADQVDNYFGHQVADPYRWLEDDMSAETAAWVSTQNKTTEDYLSQIPFRDQIKETLTKLMDYEKVGTPFTHGDYTYYFKNDGLQNQHVLYRKLADGSSEIFLDPNSFSEDGTTSLAGLSFSKDGSLVAYQISEGGSDWRKVIVLNTKTKEQVGETLVDVKFSGISWRGNTGFYYASYDKPTGSELSAKTDQHKLYFHDLAKPQSSDTLVFGGTAEQKHRYVGSDVTDDGRYLLVSAAISTSGNKLFIKDLHNPDAQLEAILAEDNSDTYLLESDEQWLYFVTNLDAPNKRVVKVNPQKPQPEHWQDFIAQTDHVLTASSAGGYIFAHYMVDAISAVKQYDMQGKLVRDIALPGAGSANGFTGNKEDKTIYYAFSNYNTPSTSFSFDVESGKSTVYQKPKINFNSDDYVSEQVFYTSKDGTKVPMLITHKKGLKRDGNNPTILYGYGGFNVSLTPYFSSTTAAWLEMGGVYAVANIRGGGEYGKNWHKAGTQLQKQNVFDDFISAAEYLIDENYASKRKLGVFGGSNGGLLVGAVMTQRPDLFQVALPAVGVLDMLRYHTFTSGAGWAYDYGTAEQSEQMFKYLKGYSPVHNVKAGVQYPATLVTTGDHDDRVVPAHSYKFAAELQEKQAGNNPTLIRIETNAGHGAGTPTSKIIDKYTDIFGFALHNMGVTKL